MWGHLLPRVWVKKRIQIFTGIRCPGKVPLIILILEPYPSRSYIQGKPKLLEFTEVWYDWVIIKITRVVTFHEKFDFEVVWLNCEWVVINCMWAKNFENTCTAFFFQRSLFSGLLCESWVKNQTTSKSTFGSFNTLWLVILIVLCVKNNSNTIISNAGETWSSFSTWSEVAYSKIGPWRTLNHLRIRLGKLLLGQVGESSC